MIFEKGGSAFATVAIEDVTGVREFTDLLSVNCYPNPATNRLNIAITTFGDAPVSVSVFDLSGRKVRDFGKIKVTGSQLISWDLTNDFGQRVPNGIYICEVNSYRIKLVVNGQ